MRAVVLLDDLRSDMRNLPAPPGEPSTGTREESDVPRLDTVRITPHAFLLLLALGGVLLVATPRETTAASGTCGDGTVDPGEQCDMGALNGSGSCCKNNCTFWDSSHICRAAAGECDLPETCTGTSATCPADTGAVKAAGTACTDDGKPCTLDQCNGTSTSCQHPAGNAGAVCRAAAGPCDVAETCTGASPTCPADAFLPSSRACRAAAAPSHLAAACPGA